jgi:putative nucleotidyltransferase with HDIG domain
MKNHWLGRLQAWLSHNNRGWQLLVGFICVLALSFFLHFREVRLEVLELNATAPRYIVAQIDFEFPDYETTLIIKQQAAKDIGPIYQIDDKEIRDARCQLEHQLIHDRQWRKVSPSSTFEEMYKAADQMETLLLEARFADPRTIQKIKELDIPIASYYELLPAMEQQPLEIPSDFWIRIGQQLSATGVFHPETVTYIVDAFQQHPWVLLDDPALAHSLRSIVTRAVPEKITFVQAGHRMINQGEQITSRHLTMMQAMKNAISESRKLEDPLTMIASFLLSLIFVSVSAYYFRISQPAFVRSIQQISLFVCIVILTLCFAKLTEFILLKSSSSIIEGVRYPIVAPFATILICILLSPRTALFAATFLSIILSVSLAVDHSRFLVLNLVTSIVVIISTTGLRKRKEVFSVCMKSWISAILVLFTYSLSEGHFWSGGLAIDIGSSFFFLILTAVLVVGLLPALEWIFGIQTDMMLMEFMDPNNELLRRMAVEIPGTYQHSLVLGNLAETCAQSIGAHGLFCRVATLYHDVGKLLNPQFYTENQQGAVNIHQLLTPLESAQVIISHVTDGENLAKKYRLPRSFQDIILQHHGTTIVYYFYRKQIELKGGNKEEVDADAFRYPGPKPRTKESAIIMICDTVEAASRSLEEFNEQTITALIDRLVREKGEEGQFEECQLTFEELGRVKRTLAKSLLLTQHVRIKYPKRDKGL